MTNRIETIKKVSEGPKDLSQFLKRKRLELGLRLEDLSNGICSSSYLSRIENSIVDVSPSFYEALFEKMNLNYEELKKERSRNLYHEIIQAYFRQNSELIEEIVEHALVCNNYVEVEIDLMLLFYNVITHKFDEARDIIIKLDDLYENFSNTELIFYLYSYALYSNLTNQNKKAYKQMLVLISIQYDDTIFECAIYDLAFRVMYVVGQISLCIKCYYHLKRIAIQPLLNTNLCLNSLILRTIDSDIDYDLNINEFNESVKFIDLEQPENKELYFYMLGKIYLNNEKYTDAYNLLIDNVLSSRITSLLVSASFHLHDYEMNNKIIEKLNAYSFTKYEKIYNNYVNYMIMVFKGESEYTLYNYLRNILLIESNFYDNELNNQIEKQFIERAIGASKYKEGLKYLNRRISMSKHEQLN